MTTELTVYTDSTDLTRIQLVAETADRVAAQTTFERYKGRRPDNTLTAQRQDLAAFAKFLASKGAAPAGDLFTEPAAWTGVSWGLVEAFMAFRHKEGYAISTVNRQLATIRRYAKLALKAGTMTRDDYMMITTIEAVTVADGLTVDAQRTAAGVATRRGATPGTRGAKKAVATKITAEQAEALKTQPDTAQGRRDALLMCLLLDHGLRESEVALLEVTSFDLADRTMTFWRPKVKKTQTHTLTRRTLAALKAYIEAGDAPALGYILRSSQRGGKLTHGAMSLSAIRIRVRKLGQRAGVSNLSPHDCRHAWATYYSRKRIDPIRMQEAGGWNSLEMVRRYIDDAKIANEGMGD